MSVPRSNTEFAFCLAEIVRRRDDEAFIELIFKLRRMPGLQAHDVIEKADAILASKDRRFLDLFLEALMSPHADAMSKPASEAQLWNE